MNTINAQDRTVRLRFVETSDVHGMFFPTDFTTGKQVFGTMARVSSYVKRKRADYGDRLILLENGDILQGQPTNYYWNAVNTNCENIASAIVNYMNYDAQVPGNHDIETGHACYDKWIKELKCPVLGANIINTQTGEPYTQAYKMLERDGVRIAILGMITPAIPNWLSKDAWRGMRFEDMVTSARKWMDIIQEKEKPNVVIGLFHSGYQGGITTAEYEENAARAVAAQVGGFDVIMCGHDHNPYSENVVCRTGGSTLILNPGSNARKVGEAEITITLNSDGKLVNKMIKGRLVSMDPESTDKEYMEHFKADIEKLQAFTSQKIGSFGNTIYTRDCFFGSAPFTDWIHNVQLAVTKADISFNSPLSFDVTINKGDVRMSDMFNLYKYDSSLYVVKMKGSEIRKYLEMSYALWTNTMSSQEDNIMLLADTHSDSEKHGFINPYYNFDSAAGIEYEVDVTKPEGEKIKITKRSNGQPFSEDEWYSVVMNSYKANGGGELITKGAGIDKDSLDARVTMRSEHDLRYYLMEEIKNKGIVNAKSNNNWRFVPEAWTKSAIERDRELIFHGNSSQIHPNTREIK